MTLSSNQSRISSGLSIQRTTCARIPTPYGEFQLCHFHNTLDDKEHLALVVGDVAGKEDVLVRVHSECFTGDVLGSLRCDCGPQLQRAMQLVAQEGEGVIVYLRQEGRNIGLLDKLRAYNLQDDGYDTVEANLMLGHQADGRDYTVAALILQDLGISSVRLLTNNPSKISGLTRVGIEVTQRIPLQEGVNLENIDYLRTKAERMDHLLELETMAKSAGESNGYRAQPLITLTFAQSIDGSIAVGPKQQTQISGPESMTMTHRLRAHHDAILVGVGTILSDDPRLTTRLVEGSNPQPVILDSHLRTPIQSRILTGPLKPWIVSLDGAPIERQLALQEAGAQILVAPQSDEGLIDLESMLATLYTRGVRNLMVEGGARVIASFIAADLADQLVLTIAPEILNGTRPYVGPETHLTPNLPRLVNPRYQQLGRDVILVAEVVHGSKKGVLSG